MEQLEIETTQPMTHRFVVQAAYNWVLGARKCGFAFKELHAATCNGECPDVIGFQGWGFSILIEAKVSRSDFHADKKKMFRLHPESGMGTQRFYACPKGVLKKEDMPEGWGLIYVDPYCRCRCIWNPYKYHFPTNPEPHKGFKKNLMAETQLMYSALRRLHIRNRIEEIYNPEIIID